MNLQQTTFSVVALLLLILSDIVSAQISGNYTSAEKKALTQFRSVVSSELYRDFMKPDEYLIRWLRDQDLNVKKAQDKLSIALKWRKQNQLDTILDEEDFSDIEKMCPYTIDGRDRRGRPILTVSLGSCPIRKIVLGGNVNRLRRMLYFAFEAAVSIINDLQKRGSPIVDALVIADISNFNLREHGCIQCIPVAIDALTLYESYYPLYVAHVFVINVPRVAETLLPILLPLLSERSKKGLHIFGYNKQEWQPAVLKYVAADQIEAQYGGTKAPKKFVPFSRPKKLKAHVGGSGTTNRSNVTTRARSN